MGTPNDLEEYASRILPYTRLGGFAQINDVVHARHCLQILGDLLDKYPHQRRKIQALVFSSSMPNGDVAHWDKIKLVINTRERYDIAYFKEDIFRGVHHAVESTDPAVYVITHEFGHILEERSLAARTFKERVERLMGAKGDNARSAVVDMGWLSEYGRYSWAEAIAEGFATMELSPVIASQVERWAHQLLIGEGVS